MGGPPSKTPPKEAQMRRSRSSRVLQRRFAPRVSLVYKCQSKSWFKNLGEGQTLMTQAVSFYSEGFKLSGDLYLPAKLGKAEKRTGIVLCHGYTGVRNLYLPEIA